MLASDAPGHDPSAYVCERRSFPAPDGTPVGATLVRRRDTPLDGTAPALLYGYGAYESSFEPEWDAALPSLLDRGVVFVHTHVRGGGEGGRRWWLDGRLEHKQNTFDDHAAVADGLAAQGLVDGTRIATRGLSAGGLLQGAVLSQRPERWRAVVAEVPFVDVVTTMFDASIPLTVNEWDEWGDPRRTGRLRLDAGLLAVRQPAAGRRSPRPARHRGAARPARHGVGAGEVGGRAAGERPGVGAALPVPLRDRRRRPRRARRAASPTSPTRPRSRPGSSTGSLP